MGGGVTVPTGLPDAGTVAVTVALRNGVPVSLPTLGGGAAAQTEVLTRRLAPHTSQDAGTGGASLYSTPLTNPRSRTLVVALPSR